MKSPAIFALLAVASLSLSAQVLADDLSTGQMIQQLQPKKALTRSLTGGSPVASPEDKAFVSGLQGATRGIIVEGREKLSELVTKYDMPKLDLEVYFDFDSAKVREAALPTLIKLGQTLTDPSLASQRIIISGHTDAVGSETDNQKLSEARADAVKSFLVTNFQIDPLRVIAVGYGEEKLKNTADPEADENRRVTVVNIVM
ncbi:MAG: OmpA family protein [Verrucomicrobiaceae bacterium]